MKKVEETWHEAVTKKSDSRQEKKIFETICTA